MKRVLLLIALITFGSSFGQVKVTSSYSMSFTTGNFNTYIPTSSFRGLQVTADYKFQNSLFVGGSFNWSRFYYKTPQKTVRSPEPGLIVTGKEIRFMDVMPISFYCGYEYNFSENLSAFGSIGIGLTIVDNQTLVSTIELASTDVDFLVNANVGLRYMLKSQDLGFQVSTSYMQDLTNNATYANVPLDYLNYLTLNFGLVFNVSKQ